MLRRRMTVTDTHILQGRLVKIAPHIEEAKRSAVARVVSEILAGFGSVAGRGEADIAVTVTAYVSALKGLPLWATERTCGRFGRGEVTAEELGMKNLDRAFPPTTAQVSMIARRLLNPVYDEMTKLHYALHGVERRPDPTPEERKRIGVKIKELADHLKRDIATDTERDELRKNQTLKLLAANEASLLAEYRKAGLDPVIGKDGTVTSMALLHSLGWSVTNGPRGNVLTRPTQEASP